MKKLPGWGPRRLVQQSAGFFRHNSAEQMDSPVILLSPATGLQRYAVIACLKKVPLFQMQTQ
jgi:hypothetical protein